MVTVNPLRSGTLIAKLTSLWEDSVRATHHFLTEQDIQNLKPMVYEGLNTINTLIILSENEIPVAFMGIDSDKIEMLFVSPSYFGKGYGKQLIKLGISQFDIRYVDVNEQNPLATGFYQHLGFEVFGRTETDGQGNPFPIFKMKRDSISIRQANTNDIPDLKDLYHNTIQTINRQDYTQEEADDWASCGNSTSRWEELISTRYFIVAENSKAEIVGFASISIQGYLHSMFVHKNFQRKGIASLLLMNLELYANQNNICQITSEVSITARPFFERKGYTVEKEQKRQANKLYLKNYWMIKSLIP